VLVAVSIAASAHVATHLFAIHLHAGFRAWSSVAAVSTFGPAISKRRAGKGTGSHKGCCANDGREAVANAAEA
jgi:hypothetical protein